MREVRVSVPEQHSGEVVLAAQLAGIGQVTRYDVYVHGPECRKQVLSVETSTPRARKFVDHLFAAAWFDTRECSITTREIRAILSHEALPAITPPMTAPPLEVMEDLWQISYITSSYVARAAGAAILLAYGMFENSAISIVLAALFLPFLSEVLAVSLGLCSGDRRLAKQGFFALLVSVFICIVSGALVARLYPGTLAFTDFKHPLVSFGISCLIGLAAGLSIADDAGRRYLIGVAAAVQYAVFPVWVGMCVVRGFPEAPIVWERIETFGLNVVTIAAAAACVYAYIARRKEDPTHRTPRRQ